MKDFNNAIEVSGVSKYFKVYYDRGTTLKDRILSRGRNRYERREVLKGISFEVKKGEAIGLIGKNGCGKSTTLKLLTRIIYPNAGTIELSGRVSSLLELGAGFHPDMSGRENIYMNAAVFGLTKKEIDQRLDDIIQFSEMEDFIDNPVRTYSSGMYMRLAFSVAINVDADILLIDEILAVGDISFQKKCFEKLQEIKAGGATIVIVSHSLDQIEKICDRTIWIEDGMIREEGKPRKIHEQYLYGMEQERLENLQEEYYGDIDNPTTEKKPGMEQVKDDTEDCEERNIESTEDESPKEESIELLMKQLKHNCIRGTKSIRGNYEVEISEMYITNALGEEKNYFETGEEIQVYLKLKKNKTERRGTIFLLIYRDDGVYCFGTNTFIEKLEVMELDEISNLKICLYNVLLLPGKYYFTVGIHDEQAAQYINIDKAAVFRMMSKKGDQGVVRIESQWRIE